MQLNIKSDEAYRLASRLAELTGQSLTTAVTKALRLQVEVEEKLRQKEQLKAEILSLAAEMKSELEAGGGAPITSNHDWLYDDESGLPV